jgi:elongation factor P hydroxylase
VFSDFGGSVTNGSFVGGVNEPVYFVGGKRLTVKHFVFQLFYCSCHDLSHYLVNATKLQKRNEKSSTRAEKREPRKEK